MNIAHRKLLAVAAIGGLALVGCDQAQRQQLADNAAQNAPARDISPKNSPTPADTARDMGDSAPKAGGSVAQAIDDAAITAKVKTALAADKDVKSSDISVKTIQGRVVLSGQVPDSSQVKLAEQKVAQIDGVQAVDNRLQPK
jgi:hyperosmotically inducible periplasmic protein